MSTFPGAQGNRRGFTKQGEWLTPGYNVDPVDLGAGLRMARMMGYTSPEHQMVVEYALSRHSRGEEDGAQRSALSGGIDLTTWYAILAAARASAQPAPVMDEPEFPEKEEKMTLRALFTAMSQHLTDEGREMLDLAFRQSFQVHPDYWAEFTVKVVPVS